MAIKDCEIEGMEVYTGNVTRQRRSRIATPYRVFTGRRSGTVTINYTTYGFAQDGYHVVVRDRDTNRECWIRIENNGQRWEVRPIDGDDDLVCWDGEEFFSYLTQPIED